MRWERVKKEVASQVYNAVLSCAEPVTYTAILKDLIASDFSIKRGLSSAELVKSYADKAYEVVMAWDVRCVGRLRDLFPDYFPKDLRKSVLAAYMLDDGTNSWVVVPKL
jgi:hypothetical protein